MVVPNIFINFVFLINVLLDKLEHYGRESSNVPMHFQHNFKRNLANIIFLFASTFNEKFYYWSQRKINSLFTSILINILCNEIKSLGKGIHRYIATNFGIRGSIKKKKIAIQLQNSTLKTSSPNCSVNKLLPTKTEIKSKYVRL